MRIDASSLFKSFRHESGRICTSNIQGMGVYIGRQSDRPSVCFKFIFCRCLRSCNRSNIRPFAFQFLSRLFISQTSFFDFRKCYFKGTWGTGVTPEPYSSCLMRQIFKHVFHTQAKPLLVRQRNGARGRRGLLADDSHHVNLRVEGLLDL
ncbi:hypothetical protein M378DRAFT_381824 [Amanita muscaria Koide BX008]|uniref:Uncharacterized protein n=1 Tax=Amanita muscaria (strain Koide BX008) TaxID=946122 RepID=A0A0C2W8J7_AMAMK|nr:hypothetical protein M378DRAFT_381824 [Amanita muscaria Koide BX008]